MPFVDKRMQPAQALNTLWIGPIDSEMNDLVCAITFVVFPLKLRPMDLKATLFLLSYTECKMKYGIVPLLISFWFLSLCTTESQITTTVECDLIAIELSLNPLDFWLIADV